MSDPESALLNQEASSKAKSGPAARRRQALLLTLATIALVAAWVAMLRDPFYRDRLRALFAYRSASVRQPPAMDYALHEANDPPLGAVLPATAASDAIRRSVPQSPNGYLLASLGSCDTCTTLSLPRLYEQTRPRGITLLAIAHGEEERIRQMAASYRREGMQIPLIQDADRKLTVALNAYYTGRLYYFNKDWRLRWLERDSRIDNYLLKTGRFARLLEKTR
jgi:hypothetical protein